MAIDPRGSPGRLDADLPFVRRAQAGESEAFACLWRKYQPRLQRYFARATGCEADAQDLASETFLGAFQAMPRFDASLSDRAEHPRAQFSTYLHSIARNHLSNWWRHRRRHSEDSLDQLLDTVGDAALAVDRTTQEDVSSDPVEETMVSSRHDALCIALSAVDSDAQFAAILFHYVAGWSHDDVAHFLGVQTDRVNTRLQAGRKSLRREFDRVDGLAV